MGMHDEDETTALEAAIRTPWTPPRAEPYAPAPTPPAPLRPPAAFVPPRPIGYVPMPVYAYPGPGRYGPASWAPPVRVSQREVGIAYLLWFFFGVLGVHHFYLGNIARGVLYLLTGGFLGVGILVDLFLLPSLTRRRNAEAIGRLYPLAR